MRTKFVVERVYNNGQNIVAVPVKEKAARTLYDPEARRAVVVDPEVPPPADNVAFFEASPGGELHLLVVRPEHAVKFAAGKIVTIDITVDE